jgi:hypothetical protein
MIYHWKLAPRLRDWRNGQRGRLPQVLRLRVQRVLGEPVPGTFWAGYFNQISNHLSNNKILRM